MDEKKKEAIAIRQFSVVILSDLKLNDVSLLPSHLPKIEELIAYYEATEDYEICAKIVEYREKLKQKFKLITSNV